MTDEQCTALIAAILITDPRSTSEPTNKKARANAVDSAARLVVEAAARFQELEDEDDDRDNTDAPA